ncbi:MAG: NADH:ubiquinone reductase (Na(+)-transporting) subunit C [Saprospiraceae bacterium]|nr:NADH:ubiquinone reductase (Na(+)-transporting) subunit C [Saprospiraceae bacterium]
MESNAKIIRFVVILTVVVAGVLTLLREVTLPMAERNEEIFNKRAILSAVVAEIGDGTKTISDYSDDEVLDIFYKKVTQTSVKVDGSTVADIQAEDIDMAKEKKKDDAEKVLPFFTYNNEGEKFYILAVRGNGLWDEIWGYIALRSDKSTIAGAAFDHKGETPGLGAEIKDNKTFPASFKDKKINDANGQFVSVLVKKGGAEIGNPHQVDGISGATVTANGVTEMLERGIKYYGPFLKTVE